jgi:glutamate synthase (NADPH) large chain
LPAREQQAMVDPAVWHRGQSDEAQLKKMLEDHNRWTGSKRARDLLDNWDVSRSRFVKVFPIEYKRALAEIAARKSAASGDTPSTPPTAAVAAKTRAVAAK